MTENDFLPSASMTDRRILVGWAFLMLLVIATSALFERWQLDAELQTEAAILHRLASQRADQHDAHLTSLSALAVASAVDRRDLFLDVAGTILRFYPRIEAVDLVPLAAPDAYVTTRPGLSEVTSVSIVTAARSSTGRLVLQSAPEAEHSYLLVKRSPNSDDARFGLALQIDASALLGSDSPFWRRSSVVRSLQLPNGQVLTGSKRSTAPKFKKPLGSVSQPLLFQASISPGPFDLLRPGVLIPATLFTSLLYVAAMLGLRQRTRARRAERRAGLSAREARLAHASRVNALGEMASGMAHELTQPLTAILSQAQAGRHLAARGDIEGLRAVLEAVVAQSRRGSEILDRLRAWSRPRQTASGPVDPNDAVRNVRSLLQAEADRSEVEIVLLLDPNLPPVRANPVEMEQVIFNLVRNAMDAVAYAATRQVTLTTRREGPQAVLEIADTGPGVPPALRANLFEPFVTGRPGGTGLGLALCQRLIESMDGEIALDAGGKGDPNTVFRIRLPLIDDAVEAAAQ